MAETKEKTNTVAEKTLAYFMPVVWKHNKEFFLCGAFNLILRAAQPFVSIMMTPLILDELLDGRNISRFLAYIAMIIVGNTFLSLLSSTTDVVMEKYSEKWRFLTKVMSLRVMELDFQLTEDKKFWIRTKKQ